MACYHFTLKQVSRGKGASAVAKAAYHSGERLSDAYYGTVHDYTKKAGDRKSTRLNSSHSGESRMPSSA